MFHMCETQICFCSGVNVFSFMLTGTWAKVHKSNKIYFKTNRRNAFWDQTGVWLSLQVFKELYRPYFCFVCLFFAVDDMTFQHEEDTEYEIAGHQNNFKLKSALCLQETMTLG